VIAAAFTIGIVASVLADRRDPDADRRREERVESVKQGVEPDGAVASEPRAGASRG
jgi:hypothetical protein